MKEAGGGWSVLITGHYQAVFCLKHECVLLAIITGFQCEPFNNPADFFLDVINGDSTAVAASRGDQSNLDNGGTGGGEPVNETAGLGQIAGEVAGSEGRFLFCCFLLVNGHFVVFSYIHFALTYSTFQQEPSGSQSALKRCLCAINPLLQWAKIEAWSCGK